ncbi:MAG: helix-turn-helix transcriptional regulator [candidate division NC10 bacterium]|nr:helix-turn-helix transcriptional regulator [candidate division NC10 bacterium]
MPKQKRALYMISVVADMFDIHPQTLRAYEREGLLRPARTDGNTRLYSQEDLERIELILRLTKELGVNLAGVEVILNMRERMNEMQRSMNDMFQEMLRRMETEFKHLEQEQQNAEGLVPVGRKGIVRHVPIEKG